MSAVEKQKIPPGGSLTKAKTVDNKCYNGTMVNMFGSYTSGYI